MICLGTVRKCDETHTSEHIHLLLHNEIDHAISISIPPTTIKTIHLRQKEIVERLQEAGGRYPI